MSERYGELKFLVSYTCQDCKGFGHEARLTCSYCDGTGRVEDELTIPEFKLLLEETNT